MTDNELRTPEVSQHDKSVDSYIERMQAHNSRKDPQAPTVTQPSKPSMDGVTPMKINWKVLVAIVVIVAAVIWAVDSIRSRTYEGSALNTSVGHGPVTVINPSDESV